MKQSELPLSGPELRDQGAKSVAKHSEGWAELAEREIASLASLGLTFTAEDLVERIGMPTVHANCVGAALLGARTRGLIKWTGQMVVSSRPSRHAGLIRVWKGCQP